MNDLGKITDAVLFLLNDAQEKMASTQEESDRVYEIVEMLKEMWQYKEIGTPEQFASYKAMFDDDMYRDRMLEAIGKKMTDELSEYKSIGTPDECRAAVERQRAKKPERACFAPGGYALPFLCVSCNEVLLGFRHGNYCANCGQAISWEHDAK